jgi:enoyl-CoA hydratase/carnithine racemase
MTHLLLTERDERGVVHLTLNHAAAFNPLSSAMIDALSQALGVVAADTQARVVVLGATGRAFCAGHDLKEMRTLSQVQMAALFAKCSRLMGQLQALPVPVVARVQGLATAAGCQLVAACDLAVASADARFAVSGINYGAFCATPGVALSRNVGRKAAMEMLLTGEFISAHEARAKGLVNRVADVGQLDAEVEALVASILAKPPTAVAAGKRLFYQQLELGTEAAYQLAGQVMACDLASANGQEGLAAFSEKRQATWPTDRAGQPTERPRA